MIESGINILLEDPLRFALGASVFGLYFLFKKYDKSVDRTISAFKMDARGYSKDIKDFMDETKIELKEVRAGMYADNKEFKDNIRKLKDEIVFLSEKINIEITALRKVYSADQFAKKLAEYDNEIEKLKKDYGKVILLESELAKAKDQDEIHYKMFMKIAEKLSKLK